MKQKYFDNKYFTFFNANPKDKKAADCVARAICVALNQSWEQTIREMTELGIKLGFVFNEKRVEEKYLESKGWFKMNEPRKLNYTKMTVRNFIDTLAKNETYIIYAGTHHLSVIQNKKVIDTWDCSTETMHYYYVKKGI